MLKVQLSGKVEVTVDGAAVALGSKKAQAVFVALALRGGQLVPIDRLVDLVWDNDPPRTAEPTLQSYVTRLRNALGASSIERVGDAYRLAVDPDQVDLVQFERLLDEGDTAQALDLWQGPALAGLAPSGALAAAVVGVAERYLAATEELLEQKISQGSAADTIGKLRELTTEYPYRESFWALLMRALYQGGRQSDALRAYSDARSRLIDDLGIEPGPALRELEGQILSHDESLTPVIEAPDQAASSPAQPPPSARLARARKPLAGRNAELARLIDLAESGAGVGYVLGPAGAGKSTLLESYLDTLASRGWRIAKSSCVDDDAAPPLWPWRQVFRELNLDETSFRASSEMNRFELFDWMHRALYRFADDGPIAICIDDLHWSGVDTLSFFSYLRRQSGHKNLALVGAGRGVPSELAALDIAWIDLPPLGLAAISAIVEAETSLSCDQLAAQRLLERTGGNPFFVTELARAAGRSRKALDINVELPHHVSTAVQQRLDVLPPESLNLLGYVALALVECSVELIADASGNDPATVTEVLRPAFDAGVLVSDDSGLGRFGFDHAITRETVEARLDAKDAAHRHAALGHSLDGLLLSSDSVATSRLSRHFALGAPAGTANEAVVWGLVAAQQAAQTWSHSDAIVHLERAKDAMAHAKELDPSMKVSVLIRLGQSARIVGDAETAADALLEAFRLADRMGDSALMAEAALSMAEGYGSDAMSLGWVPGTEATAAMERALEACPSEDSIVRAQLLGQLGADRYDRSEGNTSEPMLDEALAMSIRLDDPRSIVQSRQFRRAALAWKWDFDDALAHDRDVLRLTQEHGLREQVAQARSSYIASLLHCGDLAGVRSVADELATEARLSGTTLAHYYDVRMKMQLASLRGDWAEIDDVATAALDPESGLGPEFASGIVNQYGMAQIYQGETAAAVEHLRYSAQVGNRRIYSRILFSVLASSGQFDEAAQLLSDIDLTTRSGGQFGRGYAIESVCEGLAAMDLSDELGDLVDYLRLTEKRLVMNASGRDGLLLLGPARYFLARGLTALGECDEAEHHLAEARPRMEQLEAVPHLVQLDFAEAMVAHRRQGATSARDQLEHAAGVAMAAGMKDYALLLERALSS